MAGKDRYLLNRDGRYFARIVVPKNLQAVLGKSELRVALGSDRRLALKELATAVSALQLQIGRAERQLPETGPAPLPHVRFAMTFDEIAKQNYVARLAQDDAARLVQGYANIAIDTDFAVDLRNGIAGKLTNHELAVLVGHRIEGFKEFGNTAEEFGSIGWRDLAQKLCRSEYEALVRVQERDEGDFEGEAQNVLFRPSKPPQPILPGVSIRQLVEDYNASQKLVGKGRGAETRWAPVFNHLIKFVGHDDARKLTKQNLIAWRDQSLLEGRSGRTVGTVWLAAVKAVLSWAVGEDRLDTNVAAGVRQASSRSALSRPKGYTDSEAQTLLQATWNYEPSSDREYAETIAAKQWVSLLCALTGARVTEITQLRKKDVRCEGTIWILRLSPDAGTLKVGDYRDVPIHPQLIELGFLKFVDGSEPGPLFYRCANVEGERSGARAVSGKISEWLNKQQLVPAGVRPSHGWRHRFMTVAYEVKASERIVRAICGHGDRNVGETYGDVTVKARLPVIMLFPRYRLSPRTKFSC